MVNSVHPGLTLSLLHLREKQNALQLPVFFFVYSASRVWNIGASHIEDFGPCYNVKSHVCHDFLVLSKNILGKAIDSYWFKMSCLISLVFHCVYCFFLKRWDYIKIFVLHKLYFCKKNLLQIDVINVAKIYVIYYRSIFILRRTLLWIFGKWKQIWPFQRTNQASGKGCH